MIDRINYGAGIQCCASWRMYIVLLREVDRSARAFKQIQHEVEYERQYKRRSSVRLHIRRTKLKRPENRCLKSQLDPKPATRKGKKASFSNASSTSLFIAKERKTTHPYSLRSRKSADHICASIEYMVDFETNRKQSTSNKCELFTFSQFHHS